jgi:hypothetical protein
VADGSQTDVGNSEVEVEIEESFNSEETTLTFLNNINNDNSDNSVEVDDSFNDFSTSFDLGLDNVGNTDNSVDIDGDVLDIDAFIDDIVIP